MDNGFIERVWRLLKFKDVYLKGCVEGREAKAAVTDWIILYNERCLHQPLGYRAPMAVWRVGAPPKAQGHVDNANASTRTPKRPIRDSSRQKPCRFNKRQQADVLPTQPKKNDPAARGRFTEPALLQAIKDAVSERLIRSSCGQALTCADTHRMVQCIARTFRT